MSQYRINLSTLADTYASARDILDNMKYPDQDAMQKLSQLDHEFQSVEITRVSEIIQEIVLYAQPTYAGDTISVTRFLRCYYVAYKDKSPLLEDFIFLDDSEVPISYQGLISIYGELLVDDVIDNSIHRENGVILLG